MKEGYLESRGISYRVSKLRPGIQTLVFIHGLTGSASAWYEYETRFERQFNVLTMDLRGHGLSKKHRNLGDYAISEMTKDISELLRFLDVTDHIIIAHSLGTLMAVELSAASIKPVPMILMSANYDIQNIMARRLIQPACLLASALYRVLPFSGNIPGRTDYAAYKGTGDWNVRRIFADIRNATLRVYLFCNIHVYNFNREDVWKATNARILIVHGEKDSVVPVDNAIRLSKIMPNSKLEVIKSANHILVLNNEKEISSLITRFAQSIC